MSAAIRAGYKQTEVGVIPGDWETESLGRIGQWFSGGTPSLSNASYWSGDIPWVSPKDMKLPRLWDAIDHISLKAATDGARVLPVGAVLMVIRGMILAHSFPVARVERPLAFNQDIKAVVPRADVDSNFVLYWLMANRQRLRALTTESTHGTKRLPSEALFRQEFCRPPLPEQRAIAAALSDVDALLAKLDAFIAKKRDLKQAAMQQLLTGQTRLPGFGGEWEVKRLGDVGRFLKGSGVRKDESLSGDLRCIRYGEIYTRHNDYIKAFHSWISSEVAQTAVRLKQGDLCFAGSGETKEDIGKCVAFVDDSEAYAGGDIVILRPENANAVFLGYYLNTRRINSQKASRGQGDAVVHISATALSSIEIVVPDLDEQTAIATILSDMDTELAALEARRDKTRALKQGMMQELLTGRIRLLAS